MGYYLNLLRRAAEGVMPAGEGIDPRPDLAEDSVLWEALLGWAARHDPGAGTEASLFGLLHGLRCGGCRLVRRPDGRLRLNYTALLDGWDETELREHWLMPNRQGIAAAVRAAEGIGRGVAGRGAGRAPQGAAG